MHYFFSLFHLKSQFCCSGRLSFFQMNHTDLWKDSDLDEEDEEERIGDDLLTPSAEAHKLYHDSEGRHKNRKSGRGGNGGGGSWLLRQSIGKGPSLGEKIGEAAETAAYKAVAGAGKTNFFTRFLCTSMTPVAH
jgi:hypothetical protein